MTTFQPIKHGGWQLGWQRHIDHTDPQGIPYREREWKAATLTQDMLERVAIELYTQDRTQPGYPEPHWHLAGSDQPRYRERAHRLLSAAFRDSQAPTEETR